MREQIGICPEICISYIYIICYISVPPSRLASSILSAPSYAVFVFLLEFVKLLRLRRFLSCFCNKKRNLSHFVGMK